MEFIVQYIVVSHLYLIPQKEPKHVYTNFEKVDIFVVKGDISWYRRLKSKNERRIQIQRAEKHTKMMVSNKMLAQQNFQN